MKCHLRPLPDRLLSTWPDCEWPARCLSRPFGAVASRPGDSPSRRRGACSGAPGPAVAAATDPSDVSNTLWLLRTGKRFFFLKSAPKEKAGVVFSRRRTPFSHVRLVLGHCLSALDQVVLSARNFYKALRRAPQSNRQ